MITEVAGWNMQGRCTKTKSIKMFAGLAMSLLSFGVQAQLKVTAVSSPDPALSLKFPLVSGGRDVAMSRINTWLQVSELEKLPGRYKNNLFEDVLPKPDEALGIASLSYEVQANTPSYLSLRIQSRYTGISLNDYSFDYSFDAQTGRLITLMDLFSPQGLTKFRGAVHASRLSRIDAFLAKLSHAGAKRSRGSEAGSAKSPDGSGGMYAKCRKNLDRDDLLILRKDTLTVSLDCAGTHYNYVVVDELGPLDDSYSFAALDDMLNDYGHCLLVEQRTDCIIPRHDPAHGIWHGMLDRRYPITLVYGTYGTDGYFYDRFAKFIALEGGLQADGSLRFTEILRSGPNAKLVLQRQADGGFKGKWTQEDTGKTLRVELTNEL